MTATAAAPAGRPWIGPTMLIVGAIAIGFAPIGLRLSHFGPQATAFWRFLFALPMIAAVIYAAGGRIGRPTWYGIAAGVFFGLDIALWHKSVMMTSVANATFLVNLGNVSVGLIAWLALKERPTRSWLAALVVALAGALLLSRGAANESAGEIVGDLLALLAAVMIGLYLFFAKLARRQESALDVLFWTTAAALVVSIFAAAIARETVSPPRISWLVTPLFLAIVAQVAGQGLIVAGVGRTPAALAGILLLVQPVVGAFLAWLMFDERLTLMQLSGAALVLFAVWLAGRR